MPHHITNVDCLVAFKEVISLTLNKEKLRATDYRKALLKLVITLTDKNLLDEDEKNMLLLFSEMMGVYYQNDDKRTP